MPSAPKAPCVDVWLSPHTMVAPGSVKPCSRTNDMNDALTLVEFVENIRCEVFRIGRQLLDLNAGFRGRGCLATDRCRNIVIDYGERLFRSANERPARRNPSNACGLVTSWTRWRST